MEKTGMGLQKEKGGGESGRELCMVQGLERRTKNRIKVRKGKTVWDNGLKKNHGTKVEGRVLQTMGAIRESGGGALGKKKKGTGAKMENRGGSGGGIICVPLIKHLQIIGKKEREKKDGGSAKRKPGETVGQGGWAQNQL